MSQEETYVHSHGWPIPPPPRMSRAHRVPLKKLWNVLPEGNRRRTLQSLSHLIQQHLRQRPAGQEVYHDRD
jgi:hypothetical protein